jgi:hypothetical protein
MTAHRPQALVSRACSAFFQLRPFYSGVCPEKHTSASEMISLVRERSTTHDADHEARPVRGHPGRRLRSGTLVVRTAAGLSSSFFPHDTEAVWELAEHRYLYIVQQPEHAGHARLTLFVEDLDALVAQIAERGLDPVKRETYSNGVRKITYHDPDGNEIGLGGAPLSPAGNERDK